LTELQTLQVHPMIGTPKEVPVPRKVIFMSVRMYKMN